MLRGEEEARLVEESDSMLEVELLRELVADQHLLRTNLSLTRSFATLKLNSVTLRTGCAMPASVEIDFCGLLLISSTASVEVYFCVFLLIPFNWASIVCVTYILDFLPLCSRVSTSKV